MKIGIITAMSSEQKQVEQLLANKKEYVEGPFQYTEGTIQNNTVILMKCGIGKVNAAAGTVELIRNFHPDCIISTGVAGGIDSGLKVMDVVAGSQIVYHDVWCGEGNAYGQIQGLPALFEGNDTLFNCAMSLDTETAIHGGLICRETNLSPTAKSSTPSRQLSPQDWPSTWNQELSPKFVIYIRYRSSVSALSATLRVPTIIGNNTPTSGAPLPTVHSR